MIHLLTLDTHVVGRGENPKILLGLREPKVDPDKYPVLTKALESRHPAHDLVVEWLVDAPEGKIAVERNYQQIFRAPFTYAIDGSDFGDEAEKALERLLAMLEECLIHGIPSSDTSGPWPLRMMGGVRHYLGRDLEDDTVELRPLQMPILLLHRSAFDLFNDHVHEGEWLCETSCIVKAGRKP